MVFHRVFGLAFMLFQYHFNVNHEPFTLITRRIYRSRVQSYLITRIQTQSFHLASLHHSRVTISLCRTTIRIQTRQHNSPQRRTPHHPLISQWRILMPLFLLFTRKLRNPHRYRKLGNRFLSRKLCICPILWLFFRANSFGCKAEFGCVVLLFEVRFCTFCGLSCYEILICHPFSLIGIWVFCNDGFGMVELLWLELVAQL